jgi:hypothetical protein
MSTRADRISDLSLFSATCNLIQDPLMAQFPLALAIEPRLLPLAAANGFVMDSKYRDFIFRKMFEHLSSPNANLDKDPEDIVHHVQELSRLDPSMYLSRTVAAEICVEAKQNIPGYTALKKLYKLHELRFDLPKMVEELLEVCPAVLRCLCLLMLFVSNSQGLPQHSTYLHIFMLLQSSPTLQRLSHIFSFCASRHSSHTLLLLRGSIQPQRFRFEHPGYFAE